MMAALLEGELGRGLGACQNLIVPSSGEEKGTDLVSVFILMHGSRHSAV